MKVSIHKSGKFYWKLQRVPHRQSVAVMRFKTSINGEDVYETQFGWMIHFYQFFLFWWVLAVDIKHDTKGFGKPELYKKHDSNKSKYEEIAKPSLS